MNDYITLLIEYKNIPYSKSFLEPLYNYFKSENFDPESLIELGEFLNIKPNVLKTYIYNYAKEFLKMNKDEFKMFRNEQIEKNKENFIGQKNVILESYGINTKFLFNNDQERLLLLEGIYNYAKNNNFSTKSTSIMSKKLNITEEKYLGFIKEYVENYLEKEEKNKQINNEQKKEQVRLNKKLISIYDSIINFDTSNSVMKLYFMFNCTDYSPSYLEKQFVKYEKNYTTEEVKSFYDKCKICKEYKKDLKKKTTKEKRNNSSLESDLLKATSVINDYMNTYNLSFEEFLNIHNINKNDFTEYIRIIKLYDMFTYNNYLSKKEELESIYEDNLRDKTKLVIDGLLNGYEENGVIRKFDIIDYFSITSLPLSKFSSVSINKYIRDNQYIVRKFCNRNRYIEKSNTYEEHTINQIMENEKRIGAEVDKFGRVIENSGRIITDEEKRNIINYLKKKNIVVNMVTFNAAFKRYIKGFLNFELKELKLEKKENS